MLLRRSGSKVHGERSGKPSSEDIWKRMGRPSKYGGGASPRPLSGEGEGKLYLDLDFQREEVRGKTEEERPRSGSRFIASTFRWGPFPLRAGEWSPSKGLGHAYVRTGARSPLRFREAHRLSEDDATQAPRQSPDLESTQACGQPRRSSRPGRGQCSPQRAGGERLPPRLGETKEPLPHRLGLRQGSRFCRERPPSEGEGAGTHGGESPGSPPRDR